jgi:hypothetical protein
MKAETTFSMFQPAADRTLQKTLLLSDPPPPVQDITEKYRPQCFDDVYGQPAVIERLRAFVANPYPKGFLFAGDTGSGKSSCALALATELGIDQRTTSISAGLIRLHAGAINTNEVSQAFARLRFAAGGSGWKMIIADEADTMSSTAKVNWLSFLEQMPPKSVVVFTSNHDGRFEQRFVDRCIVVPFESRSELLMDEAQRLFARIWRAEGLPGEPYAVADLDLVRRGVLSFRRVVSAIEPFVAAHAAGTVYTPPPRPPVVPVPNVPTPTSTPRRKRVSPRCNVRSVTVQA